MFRQFAIRISRAPSLGTINISPIVLRPVNQVRVISASCLLQKKLKRDTKEYAVPTTDEPSIDLKEIEADLAEVIEKFSKQATNVKIRKSNPQIFDRLVVETADGEMPYSALAQTNVKGRNFVLTVYDPANVQCIINAVLSSNLNLNPVVDPSNKLTLKVPLPPITTDSKKDSVKELKAVYEKFKNGLGKKGSLSGIRSTTRHKLSKNKKLDNTERAVWEDYEKLHKSYTAKLDTAMRAAELAIMK